MSGHKVPGKTITLANGDRVHIKYWASGDAIFVAGFDDADVQVSATEYSAKVCIADDLQVALKNSLVGTLVAVVESDLRTNPQLHYRPKQTVA